MKKTYQSNSPEETRQIASELAKNLSGGEIIGLIGELGSGKTFFVQAVGQELGVKQNITSPTFILLKNYPTNHKKIKHLIHVDAYRLADVDELIEIGIEEYLNRKDSLVCIEWADKVKNILPAKTIWLKFKYLKQNKRRIEIYWPR